MTFYNRIEELDALDSSFESSGHDSEAVGYNVGRYCGLDSSWQALYSVA